MNNKKKLITTFLIVVMMIPFLGHSQSLNKIPTITGGASLIQKWEPVYAFKDYNNIMQSSPTDVGTPSQTNIEKGVSFYNKACNTAAKNVVLLKLINSNNYSVKISWQLSAELPITDVVVPANSEMEGSCTDVSGGVTSKLSIQIPEGADKEKIKEYSYTHIFVTELKE